MQWLNGFTAWEEGFLFGLIIGLGFSAIFAAWLLMSERD